MKKRILGVFLCLCLVLAVLPLAASAASGLTIAGNAIDDTGYYQMTSATTVSAKLDAAPGGSNYFHWDNSSRTLTLYGVTVGGSGIRFDSLRDLTIVLAAGSVNTVTTETGSAVVHQYGNIIISGKGTLNATGQSNGSWVMDDLTIKDGATVNLVGKTGAGFMTQYRFCELIVEAGCNATFTGATYGICSQNDSSIRATIKNAKVTASGGTAAIQSAPTLEGVSAIASTNQDGSGSEAYVAANNANYKWFTTNGGSTPTTTTTKPTTVSTPKPTTVSTVKPTTVSTVKPTTVSSTKPTTVSSTKPTTVSTTESTTAPITSSSTESTVTSTSSISTADSTTKTSAVTATSSTQQNKTDRHGTSNSASGNMLWLWIVLGVAGLGIVVTVIVLVKKKTAK